MQARGRVVYLSDLSLLMPATLSYLQEIPIDILVIDAIFVVAEYGSHLNLPQCLALTKVLRPNRAVLVSFMVLLFALALSVSWSYDSLLLALFHCLIFLSLTRSISWSYYSLLLALIHGVIIRSYSLCFIVLLFTLTRSDPWCYYSLLLALFLGLIIHSYSL